MTTAAQRTGHLLRIKAPKLTEAILDEQYRRQPDLHARYGTDGRRYCARDLGHHLQSLAAAVDLGVPAQFVKYVEWARGVMTAHGIAAEDFLVSLQVLLDVVPAHLPAAVANLACAPVDAALAAWPAA